MSVAVTVKVVFALWLAFAALIVIVLPFVEISVLSDFSFTAQEMLV